MTRIEFALWANEQAVFGIVFLVMASIVSAAGQFPRWEASVAAGALGLLLLAVEWSRPARSKGRVQPRTKQEFSTKFVKLLGRFGESYYVRFIVILLIAAPSSVSLPTLLPAVCLLFSSLTYLFAATRGETWRPIQPAAPPRAKTFTEPTAPSRPPPRLN